MSQSLQALAKLHIAVLLFGLSGLFGKLIPIDPSLIVFGRTLTGSLILLFVLVAMGKIKPIFESKQSVLDLLMGSVLAVHWVTFFQSVQVSSVAVGLLAFSSYPIFVTLLEPLLYREKIRSVDLITALAVVTGISIIFPFGDIGGEPGLASGIGWGVLSAFLFALLSLGNRKRVQKADPLALTFLQNTGAMITALFILPGSQLSLLAHYSVEVMALGALCTTLPLMLFLSSLRHLKAQLVSVISCLEPVYGIILAALLLSEAPSQRTLLGGAIILFAIALGTVSSRSKTTH